MKRIEAEACCESDGTRITPMTQIKADNYKVKAEALRKTDSIHWQLWI